MVIAYPLMLAFIFVEGVVLIISIVIRGREAKAGTIGGQMKRESRAVYLTVLLALPPTLYFGRLAFSYGLGAFLVLFLVSIAIPILHFLLLRP